MDGPTFHLTVTRKINVGRFEHVEIMMGMGKIPVDGGAAKIVADVLSQLENGVTLSLAAIDRRIPSIREDAERLADDPEMKARVEAEAVEYARSRAEEEQSRVRGVRYFLRDLTSKPDGSGDKDAYNNLCLHVQRDRPYWVTEVARAMGIGAIRTPAQLMDFLENGVKPEAEVATPVTAEVTYTNTTEKPRRERRPRQPRRTTTKTP